MPRFVTVFTLVLVSAGSVHAQGGLIPSDKTVPPLTMTAHEVSVTIEEQVAVTHIQQTFHNHTNQQLEATYYLPVPKGANVKSFSMWVDDKLVSGELVEAGQARKIYNDIVRRTLDPGLLEYMNQSLLKMRIFPVPPNGDQKITVSYTSVNLSENNLIEYVYPMKGSDNRDIVNQGKFVLNVNLNSKFPVQNIYSPSHDITMTRANDRQARISIAGNQIAADRDFQLFYTISTKDVGLNTLAHRMGPDQDGYFMLLISPRAELSKSQKIPRDMVFVLDTSGSMRGKRMTQARAAVKYCLANLSPGDRFGLMNFATTVSKYADNLLPATKENLEAARKWVEKLEATGGTAINAAMGAALEMRTADMTRPFTIVFFTDGQPTIGETNPEKILANVNQRNTANTRIFTFGVGDDVNATFLDALADNSRAIATYVRETEDIEAKTTGLYAKISNPVLANLKLSVSGDVKLNEIYPPQLPDLFHGSQLVLLGRFNGKGGKATVTLTGTVGSEKKEFTYEVDFPERTEHKPFVEDLWARRKVGYVLDQIRTNGEKKELVEEVVSLAKRYGITTPYTSYLVVPDGPEPVTRPKPGLPRKAPAALAPADGAAAPQKLADFARQIQAPGRKDALENARNSQNAGDLDLLQKRAADSKASSADKAAAKAQKEAVERQQFNQQAKDALGKRDLAQVQAGGLGVDLSVQSSKLRNQSQVVRTASRVVQNRNCVEVGGVWIDDGYDPKAAVVTIKAMSNAYFRILEKQPQMREVFQLGNYLVWVAPSGTTLIIDQNDGQQEIADADVDRLFVAAPKQ